MNLSTRMKSYEEVYNYKLLPRAPIIARLDGKGFHNFTKNLKLDKPFDQKFSTWMSETVATIASNIQGCMIGYTQSDEITLVIRTDQSEETTPWFDNRILKMNSILASMATASFMRSMLDTMEKPPVAYFDCRIGAMPNMTEVVNNLIWRQQDCVKNSISSAAYYEIGKKIGRGTARKALHKLNSKERQEILFQETGINWSTYKEEFKNGIVTFRKEIEVETEHGPVIRKRWVYEAAPIFQSDAGREWLQQVLNPEREQDGKDKEVRQNKSSEEG
ncbi:MAG: tRNA(His) guanylyltransferase Thg1 family protein [Patescibacteria group bacterium]